MRLDPLYTVTFTTPEAWSVEVASDAGIEGRGFLLAEGRSAGCLSARRKPRGQLPSEAVRWRARARVPRGSRDRRRCGDPVRVAGARGAGRLWHATTARQPRA